MIGSCSYDKTIKLWDNSGNLSKTLKGHIDKVIDIDFSPNELFIVSVSSDQTLKIWDMETGKIYQNLEGHQGKICTVCFSPNG